MKLATLLLATTLVLPAAAAFAEDAHHRPGVPVAQANANAGLADGVIRKVDNDAKKITIKHGPIQSLDMPAMTMVFQVKEPAMLEQVKAGDKVKFAAEKLGGAYTVTKIEKAD